MYVPAGQIYQVFRKANLGGSILVSKGGSIHFSAKANE
jgi:hypothetical protein